MPLPLPKSTGTCLSPTSTHCCHCSDPVLLCACACWLSAHFDALPSALITRWGANSEHRRLISSAHRIGNALAAGL
jgi:hypothetical protein